VRLGTSITQGAHRVEPFIGLSAWHEFEGHNKIHETVHGLNASDDASGWFGEVTGGVNIFDVGSSGLSGFAKGNYQFGDNDYSSFSGQVGVRLQW